MPSAAAPDPLRGPLYPPTAEGAWAVIADLEASTAHMRSGGDRALAGVIAWNQARCAELHEQWGDQLDRLDPGRARAVLTEREALIAHMGGDTPVVAWCAARVAELREQWAGLLEQR